MKRKILENKPYVTKKELTSLLGKKDRNLDKKIQLLLDKKELIPLKNGVYVSRDYLLKSEDKYPEYVANILYYPSYLSLEYVLEKENVIPESVYSYTSITLKTTREFENELGRFSYRKIKKELFVGYEELPFIENYKIKQASRAKALFDWLYLKTFNTNMKQEIEDLRINWSVIEKEDISEFGKFAELSQMKKMQEIYKLIKERVK